MNEKNLHTLDAVRKAAMEAYHTWYVHTPPQIHIKNKVRHIILMSRKVSSDCQSALAYLGMIQDIPLDGGPRYAGAVYRGTMEQFQIFEDVTGTVKEFQVMAGVPEHTIQMGLAAQPHQGGKYGMLMKLPPSAFDAIMNDLTSPIWDPMKSITAPWYGKSLYNQPSPTTKYIKGFDPAREKGPADASAKPYLYLLCEGCGNLIDRPPAGTLNAFVCDRCHGYRFNPDIAPIKAAAKRLLNELSGNSG